MDLYDTSVKSCLVYSVETVPRIFLVSFSEPQSYCSVYVDIKDIYICCRLSFLLNVNSETVGYNIGFLFFYF